MRRIVGLFFFAILSSVLMIAGALLFPIVILLLPFYLFLSKKSNEEVRKNSILYAFYEMAMQKKSLFFLIYILPIFGGFYLTTVGFMELIQARNSCTWSSTEGEVIYSRYTTDNGSLEGDRGAPSMDIVYEYQVEEKKFEGKRVMYGYINNFYTSDSYRRLQEYPKDKRVMVYYHSDNPEESVLEPGIHFPYSFNLLFAGYFFLLPLFMILKYYRLYREEDEIKDKEK